MTASNGLSVLFKALETFGFGGMLVKWIKTFYANPQSCIANNGFTTPSFSLERGARQGCPLSGILFVIGLELLASAIRSDKLMKGLNLNFLSMLIPLLAWLKMLHRPAICLKSWICLDCGCSETHCG